ncbi:MAG: GHKL domain-containing protein [Lachnospiraceae bacterium]|nr:GHKL domain-containing protein [Lachnospiraceae bacterium]
MSEMRLFSGSIYLIDSILSGVYTQSFLKEKYNKRTVLAAWSTACFLIQIAVFEILGGRFPVGKAFEIVLNLCILLFMQSAFFKKERQKQLFVAFSFVAGKETGNYIVSVFHITLSAFCNRILDYFVVNGTINTLEKTRVGIKIYNTVIVILCALFYALLLSVYLRLVSKRFVKKDYLLQTQENVFLILPCVTALCISVIIKLIVLSVENGMTIIIYDTVPATKFWIPVICVLLLSTIVASVVLFQKLVQYNEETGKCAMLENQVRQMQKEIVEIQDIYADMRGLRHDMRSHLSGIALFVKNLTGVENEELERYIGKMEETVSKLDFTYRTGNPITDIIIHQKKQEAEKKQIQLEVDFAYPPKLLIDVYDIAVILNNALENAIEACGKLEDTKQIKLRSYVKGSLFFIEVENDFSGDIAIEKESGLPVSSKQNKKLHGFGISNIQRCANKYMGDIDIVIPDTGDRKRFHLTVMMYGKSAAAI